MNMGSNTRLRDLGQNSCAPQPTQLIPDWFTLLVAEHDSVVALHDLPRKHLVEVIVSNPRTGDLHLVAFAEAHSHVIKK